jgi:ABC-2 type transport system ATP-binding protein
LLNGAREREEPSLGSATASGILSVSRPSANRRETAGALTPAVTLQGVTMRYRVPKRYREYLLRPLRASFFTALRDVNLAIQAGESLAVLGANGSGKTTLLRLVAGILYPTSGSVAIRGCRSDDPVRRRRFKVGMVLNEERSFYWRLSGVQNLKFFGSLEDLYGPKLDDRIRTLVALVGLAEAANQRVSDYSSGMRQRLAIARSLLAEPDLLVMDEPTKSLDPAGAEEVRRILQRRIRSSPEMAVVMATHRVEEARQMCGRVCVLAGKAVAADLPMAEFHESPAWRSARDAGGAEGRD